MSSKIARADITPIRQRTQYTCMGASLSMALGAQGLAMDEDTVNKVMGCKPMKGASWEQAIAAAQHFGMRATLVSPCPMSMLQEWTDRGVAVMIAWNPEGRDWSHASVVFDVDAGNVHVADPNIPDPEQTVRIVPRDEFLKKWFEKWPDYLVRRPALAIEREITPDGRQILASRIASRFAARPKKSYSTLKNIRPFDDGDWATYAGAEEFSDGPPLIAESKLDTPWRVKGKIYPYVTFIADANGGEIYFTNAQGEAIAASRKPMRSVAEAERFLKSAIDYFESANELPLSFRWL